MPKVPQRRLSHGEILERQRPRKNYIALGGTRNFPKVEIRETRGRHGDIKITRQADQFVEEIEDATDADYEPGGDDD